MKINWPVGEMTKERYEQFMLNPFEKLTKEERVNGWHFCETLDFMLIHKSWPEYRYCECGE